jgi:hypothetical protein
VSLLRTIEDILALEPMGLTDGLAEPMADVFEQTLRPWTYTAAVPEVLRTTQLPLPARTAANGQPLTPQRPAFTQPRHDVGYWEQVMAGQNFRVEDDLDEVRFNRALWYGLQGEDMPYPATRDGRDWSRDRERLLTEYRQRWRQPFGAQGELPAAP